MVPFSATSILGARNSGGGKGVASRTGLSGNTPRFARKSFAAAPANCLRHAAWRRLLPGSPRGRPVSVGGRGQCQCHDRSRSPPHRGGDGAATATEIATAKAHETAATTCKGDAAFTQAMHNAHAHAQPPAPR